MATPAASAWHRRRHILSTPSTRINTVQESSSLTSPQTARFTSSAEPASQHRLPLSQSRSRQLWDQQSDSRWAQPDPLLASQAPRPSRFSFLEMMSEFIVPLRPREHNSIYKTVLVTFASIQASFLFLYAADFLAYFISLCMHGCRHLRRQHRFPVMLFFFQVASGILFGLILFAMHFLFCKVVVKQLRSWRRKLSARSVFGAGFLRLHVLHALGCVSGCVLQSITMAYVLYGPALTPISLSWSKCSPQRLASLNRQLIPEWSDLAPHALFGLISGFAYAFMWSSFGAYATDLYPFHVKTLRRVMLYVPRVLLLSAIPTVFAALPTAILQYFLTEASFLGVPESGPWTRLVELWGSILAAVSCSFITLFSWNAISVLEKQFFGPGRSLTAEVGRARGHRSQAELLAWERNNFMALAQQCVSPHGLGEDDEQLIREMLVSLSCLTRADVDMADFPAFQDASGEVWRITLHQCLAPMAFLQHLLREYNVRQFQMSSSRGGRSLFLGASRTGRSQSASSLLGFRTPFIFPDADLCIASCRIMSVLFVASFDLDTYGVVHRTLVEAVQGLLLCKEQTETFLAFRDSMRNDGRQDIFTLERMGIVDGLREVMQLRSDYETIAAIDDAIKLAMYRIIGTFRTHMYNLVDGIEVTWDRSLDRQLRGFLNYETP